MSTMYRGFSTIGRDKKFRLTDFDLVKQDLINNFNIRKGEKLMNPNFGTIIWNVIFDPYTEELKAAIVDDIQTIVNNDPRLSVDNIIITDYQQGIQIQVELRYVLTNMTEVMNLKFDSSAKTVAIV